MISVKIWRQIQKNFKWRCTYCQMPSVYLPQGLQKDHIVPRAIGGRDVVSNICPACPNCKPIKFPQLIPNPVKKSLYSIHAGKSGPSILDGTNPEQK